MDVLVKPIHKCKVAYRLLYMSEEVGLPLTDVFTEETRMENCRPNAVLVICHKPQGLLGRYLIETSPLEVAARYLSESKFSERSYCTMDYGQKAHLC